LSEARNYRRWLWDKVRPYVGRRVLEIGAGIGNYSEYLLDRDYVLLSDYDPKYVESLARRCSKAARVEAMRMDLSHISEEDIAVVSGRRIDTIVCLNVLEHIADDETAVSHLARCVAHRGRLVFINPAHRRLYSVLDRVYGHHRRYERSDATRLARAADLEVEAVEHFNVAGVAGWWWNHRLLGRRSLPRGQTVAFDRLIPFARRLDVFGFGRLGLSILLVLRRTAP